MLTHSASPPAPKSLNPPSQTQFCADSQTAATVCPACGSESAAAAETAVSEEFETARGWKRWSRCGDCRSYFMIDEYAAESETQHTRQMAWGRQDAGTRLNDFKTDMFRSTLDVIQQFGGQPGQSLLDVGCSFGGFLLNARQRGYLGAGVDLVPEAVQYVRSQGFPAQQCASLTDCNLFSAAAPVDVLSVLDAHIYWPDQRRELQAAEQLIRPGGLLVMRAITKSPFITVGKALRPLTPQLSRRLIRRAVTDHRFCMPLKSLLRTVSDSGFQVEYASPKGARHSSESSAAVRALFAVGSAAWHRLGIALAPGALIVARKPQG